MICSTCGQDKEEDEFYSGRRKCKICYNEKRKEYYENNPEKLKERSKEYRENNSEKEKERNKKYYKNNSEKEKERSKEYRENNSEKLKEKYLSNPEKRIKRSVRNWIGEHLKKQNLKVSTALFIESLPYSMGELVMHLEKQFDASMSWENYGKVWSVDHVVPRSNFTYLTPDDEDFRLCMALSNLRPIRTLLNSKKSNKIDMGTISKLLNNLEESFPETWELVLNLRKALGLRTREEE